MKIHVPLDRYCGWTVLPCEIVDVAPHLSDILTFVVHRQTRAIRHFPNGWAISNLETGYSVSTADAKTRDECLRKARAYLKSKTRAQAMRRLSKAVNELKRK